MQSKELSVSKKVFGYTLCSIFIVLLVSIFLSHTTISEIEYYSIKLALAIIGTILAGIAVSYFRIQSKLKRVSLWFLVAAVFFSVIVLIGPRVSTENDIDEIVIQYSKKVYQSSLQRRRDRIDKYLMRALDSDYVKNFESDVQIWVLQLGELEARLSDIDQSYQDHLYFLEDTVIELNKLQSNISYSQYIQAENALLLGSTRKTDQVLMWVEKNADSKELSAEAAYWRGVMAEESVFFRKAYEHYRRAVSLEPDNPFYLYNLSIMGKYNVDDSQIIGWQAKSLEQFIVLEGIESPKVTSIGNHLANTWWSKENYDLAIKYLELVLESNLKALGRDHPDTHTSYYKLGHLWSNKGDQNRSMEYYELAVAGFEQSLGKDHPEFLKAQRRLDYARSRFSDD